MPVSLWPKDKEQQLREMWAAGTGGPEIAKDLGCTHSAVIAKVHRLKLARRRPSPVRNGKRGAAAKAKREAERLLREQRAKKRIEVTKPREMTKSEMRAFLHQAVINTARAA
jgi:hypothetical protein